MSTKSSRGKGPNKLPKPVLQDGKPLDPSKRDNWEGIEPRSDIDMQEWMADERALILHYLEYWVGEAESQSTQANKIAHEKTLKKEWRKWTGLADVQTGEIYDADVRSSMESSLNAVYEDTVETYNPAAANLAHDNRVRAYELWEDFFYYQNAWNRPRSNIADDSRGLRTFINPKDPSHKKDAEKLCDNIIFWRENLIRLYNVWNIGDRTKIPDDGVGPETLHRFPDNIRRSEHRLQHRERLDVAFPASAVRLNQDAIDERHDQVEKRRKDKDNIAMASADSRGYVPVQPVPKNHKPYRAATENTPWEYDERRVYTSWESKEWGSAVASKTLHNAKMIECSRPRWEMIQVPRLISETTTLLDDLSQHIVTAGGKKKQGLVQRVVWDEVFELDEDENRVPKNGPHLIWQKPVFIPDGTVKDPSKYDGAYTARRERYRGRMEEAMEQGDEMSDVGDDDKYREDHASSPVFYSPLVEEEESSSSDSSDTEMDSEDDIETDMFTRSYLNLPIGVLRKRATGRPGSEIIDDSSDSDSSDDNCDVPSNKGKGGTKVTSGGDQSGADEGGGNVGGGNGDTGNSHVSGRRDTFSDLGDDIVEDDGEYSWYTLTHVGPGGLRTTQRDRLPQYNPDAEEEVDGKSAPREYDMYPKNPTINVKRSADFKKIPWTFDNERGVYRKEGVDETKRKYDQSELEWRPCFVMRRVSKATGKCVFRHDLRPQFEAVIRENFSSKSVDTFNKAVRQNIRRGDKEAGKYKVKMPPWSDREIRAMVEFLNATVQGQGRDWVSDNWNEVVKRTTEHLAQYRTNTMGLEARGNEAVRTKLSRAPGIQKKVAELKNHESTDNNPANYFSIADFESEAQKKRAESDSRKDTGKSKKRPADDDSDDAEDEEMDKSDSNGSDHSAGKSRDKHRKKRTR